MKLLELQSNRVGGGSYILSQQDGVFELQSHGRPPPDDPAAASPAWPASPFHLPSLPSLLEMKPTGKHSVLSAAMPFILVQPCLRGSVYRAKLDAVYPGYIPVKVVFPERKFMLINSIWFFCVGEHHVCLAIRAVLMVLMKCQCWYQINQHGMNVQTDVQCRDQHPSLTRPVHGLANSFVLIPQTWLFFSCVKKLQLVKFLRTIFTSW